MARWQTKTSRHKPVYKSDAFEFVNEVQEVSTEIFWFPMMFLPSLPMYPWRRPYNYSPTRLSLIIGLLKRTILISISWTLSMFLERQQRTNFSRSTASYMNSPMELLWAPPWSSVSQRFYVQHWGNPGGWRQDAHVLQEICCQTKHQLTNAIPLWRRRVMACFLFWAPSCSANIHKLRLSKVCVKPTNTGLLLHYKTEPRRWPIQTSVIKNYAWSCISTFIQLELFLRKMWSTEISVFSTKISWQSCQLYHFTVVAAEASDQPVSSPAVSDRSDRYPIRVVLPFKDQASADIVRAQLNLSQKIQTTVQPVFVSQKIGRDLKLRETKPPIVNQQCLVYKFECDLCDAGYVGFTRRHLHQSVEEHKNSFSSIGKHLCDKPPLAPRDLTKNLSVLMKCTNKFDCPIYEMFFYSRTET